MNQETVPATGEQNNNTKARRRPALAESRAAKAACPAFLALNRPSMTWFGDLVYGFAPQCNGIAITFGGKAGLTRAESIFSGVTGPIGGRPKPL